MREADHDLRVAAMGAGLPWTSLANASLTGGDYIRLPTGSWACPVAHALGEPCGPSGASPNGAFAGDGNRHGASLVFRMLPSLGGPVGDIPQGWEDKFCPLPAMIGTRPGTVRDAEWAHFHMALLLSESLGALCHVVGAQSEWRGVTALLDASHRALLRYPNVSLALRTRARLERIRAAQCAGGDSGSPAVTPTPATHLRSLDRAESGAAALAGEKVRYRLMELHRPLAVLAWATSH